jgi:PD-(D/E)XK nuclease superfamily
MDTNEEKLLLRDEVFQIVGCAIEVLNTLGHGMVEKPYENALVVEFGLTKIPFRQQPTFDVLYKRQKVGLFIPDLIVFNSIVVDTRGDRPDYRSRAGLDVKLSPYYELARWSDS